MSYYGWRRVLDVDGALQHGTMKCGLNGAPAALVWSPRPCCPRAGRAGLGARKATAEKFPPPPKEIHLKLYLAALVERQAALFR